MMMHGRRDLVDDLMTLLRIPSVTGNEGAIAVHFRDRIAGSGRPVVLDGRSVVVPPPSDDRPLIVLAGHLDTVPPAGNETPRLEREIAWGRGAVDMKGGLTVIAALLGDERVESGWARTGAALYAGEEGPLEQNDLRRLLDGSADWATKAELAILLEPTGSHIEVGCVGVVNLQVVFKGDACHSARPWFGKNAVTSALPWIEEISAFEPRDHTISGFTFRETATITRLHAGTANNVVPGRLTANLNYRFPPGWDTARGRAAVLALATRADEVSVLDVAPSGEVPIERPYFAAFLHRSGLDSRAKQGWTDVAQFSERGVPALNFGPGDPQYAHRDDEQIRIETLEHSFETLAGFLQGDNPPLERPAR